ncbi:nitroreductase family protein [Candidatus Bathyarchaeota archaeon]|nr:MAG: nitroreductase family protein [Candidatus Bathyarchaeota archaeon]
MKKEEAEVVMRSIETLRSVRSFKPDSIPKETLDRILRAASMAASGSNTQPWEFVVVQDRDVKARLKEPMWKKWLERIGGGTGMSQRMKETYDEATEMLRNSEKVPALVYCCLDLNRIGRGEEVRYASIYPAVQNLMLAAHAFGLGTCLTIHGSTPTRGEPEVKKILGIPENIKIACLVYMGYPSRRYGRPRRRQIEDRVRYEKWDPVA